MDIARWFLGEDKVSKRVLSIGGRVGYEDAGNTPNTQTVLHVYDKAPLIFETRGLPRKSGSSKMDRYRGSGVGVIVQCERGHVLVPSYTAAIAYDLDGTVIQEWKGGGNHYANFLKAVASRNPDDLNAEVQEGHLSSALCHTGGVSHQLGKKASADEIREAIKSDPLFTDSFERMVGHLWANGIDADEPVLTLGASLEMDQNAESFTNMDEANALVRREDRAPFTVPEVTV
jgi:hypothetical protein